MLQGRLTRVALAAGSLALATACSEGGALEENVIRPGITAMDQSRVLACNSDLNTLRTALETYELLEGSPAPDEATLVEEQFLRSESELWDIDNGRLVPTDPACGSAQDVDPQAVDIVTSTEPPRTADEMFADLTADDIAAMGGEECARQLTAIFSGVDRFVAEQGREPDGLDELEATGYLEQPVTLWEATDIALVPAEGSDCTDFMTN